jgi:hypothetical protein
MTRPLLTQEQRAALLTNGKTGNNHSHDPYPVVKLFTPDAQATWLLAALDPVNPDLAFGLCDLGLGMPELGCVRLSEIAAIRGPLRLPVERDLYFKATKPISAYANEAYARGHIAA